MSVRSPWLRRAAEEGAYTLTLVVVARWVIGLRTAGTFVWPHVSLEALLRGEAPRRFNTAR